MAIPLLSTLSLLDPATRPMAVASASSNTSSSDDTSSQGLNTMFLQLLSAQLASQSPFDPLDPNQFVGQLAQFQSLSQLSQITQLLQYIAIK